MGLQSTPRPRGSPAGALVKTRKGLAVVPRVAIGRGGREAPRQTVEPRTCGQVPGKLSTAAQQQTISVGQIDHPTAAGTSRPGYAVGDPLLKPPRRLSEGVDNGERIRGSTTCQCDVHQRPRRPSRFAWCGWKGMGGSSQGKPRGRGTQGQRRGRQTRRRQCRWRGPVSRQWGGKAARSVLVILWSFFRITSSAWA